MTYRFYNLETGRVLPGEAIYPNDDELRANTPEGYAPVVIPGAFDPRVQRIDVNTLQVVAYEPDEEPVEAIEESALRRRDAMLAASDWVTLRALDTGTPVPLEWRQYRQFLRDLTDQSGWPRSIEWPTKPAT